MTKLRFWRKPHEKNLKNHINFLQKYITQLKEKSELNFFDEIRQQEEYKKLIETLKQTIPSLRTLLNAYSNPDAEEVFEQFTQFLTKKETTKNLSPNNIEENLKKLEEILKNLKQASNFK